MNKVSIIIPVYNVEKYIKQCLDSIVNQTLKDIEIIIVDDCGSDNSIEIVQGYAQKDKRIKIVKHEKNKGLGAARNTGMQHATGEYLGYVDSDDYVCLDYFEKLYNTAIARQADIVQSNLYFYYEDKDIYKEYCLDKEVREFDTEKTNESKLEIYYNAGMCWNKIFKRELIEKHEITFPEGLYWEDNPFVIKAAYYANKICYCDNTNYIYRQRNSSIVTLKTKKLHFDLLTTHVDIVNFINSIELDKNSYVRIGTRIVNRLYWEFDKITRNPKLKNTRYEYCKKVNELKNMLLYKKEIIQNCEKDIKKMYYSPFYDYILIGECLFKIALQGTKLIFRSICELRKLCK